MVVAMDVVVIVTVDTDELVITTFHKTMQSIRSIMQKDMIEEKMFVKVLSGILKIPIIHVFQMALVSSMSNTRASL